MVKNGTNLSLFISSQIFSQLDDDGRTVRTLLTETFSKKNTKKTNKPTVTLKGTSRPITSGNYALEIRKARIVNAHLPLLPRSHVQDILSGVSGAVDLKPLDSFDKGSTFLIVTKYTYFGRDVGMSPAVFVATNNRYFRTSGNQDGSVSMFPHF